VRQCHKGLDPWKEKSKNQKCFSNVTTSRADYKVKMTRKSIQIMEVEVTFMQKGVYEVVIMINASSIHVSKPSLWFEDGMEVRCKYQPTSINFEGYPFEKIEKTYRVKFLPMI
jgi:hypothetical protein